MVEHVKLEIAIQLCAEKIDSIYTLLESTEDEVLRKKYEQELIMAFQEKERVFNGEADIINRILEERRDN